jgi:hypothetical protein
VQKACVCDAALDVNAVVISGHKLLVDVNASRWCFDEKRDLPVESRRKKSGVAQGFFVC